MLTYKLYIRCQVESLLDRALKSGNFQALDELLLDETREGKTSKCSKQFISKLDRLIIRVGICLVFAVFYENNSDTLPDNEFLVCIGTGPQECEECLSGIYCPPQAGENAGLSKGRRDIRSGVTRTCQKDK